MQGAKSPCLLAAGALLLGALGCGGGLTRSPRPSAEVVELKRQIRQLQIQARVDEVELARLRKEIAALEKELAEGRAAPAGSAAAGPVAPAPAAGDLEEPTFRPVEAEVEETELEEGDAPPVAAPPVAAPPAVVPPPASPETLAPAAQPAAATEEALSLYDEGYTLFHQQRYDEAEERFRRYLTLYADTDLADNAQFWIGECHYARGDFAAALEAFTGTVELYPQGNKVADALLKAGRCLEELGQPEEARQTYHEITDRFPSSSAAAVARERLTTLE